MIKSWENFKIILDYTKWSLGEMIVTGSESFIYIFSQVERHPNDFPWIDFLYKESPREILLRHALDLLNKLQTSWLNKGNMQEKTVPIETETKTLFWDFKRAMTENLGSWWWRSGIIFAVGPSVTLRLQTSWKKFRLFMYTWVHKRWPLLLEI